VRSGARFCRECGASEESGWNEDDGSAADETSGYGPDDDFDYDEYIAREFPDQTSPTSKQRIARWAMAVLVAIVVAALLASVCSQCFR